MKLVFYNNSMNVIQTLENIKKPEIDGKNIKWEDGSLTLGTNLLFLLLGDEVEVLDSVTDELVTLDKKSEFIKFDEVAELKKQLQAAREENEMNALAIMELAQMVLGG